MRVATLVALFVLFAVVSALLLEAIPPRPAIAGATITVSSPTDELTGNGTCSLREAIQAANTDAVVDACIGGSGADVIVVPAGTYTLTLPGADEDANHTGDLDITDDLTINGASTIVQACDSSGGPCTGIDRVLDVVEEENSQSTVTISGVTIRNGSTSRQGGGISNYGALTITNATISGNTAISGGGVDNHAGLSLTNSTVGANIATGGLGGGIVNGGNSSTITNSTVSGNIARSFGGGIYHESGPLTVTNSTVSGNTATGGGTALTAGGGGGIFNAGISLTIVSSTVSGNAADSGGGIKDTGNATLTNSIVANSPYGGNCVVASNSFPSGDAQAASVITSFGHNLSSDASCAFAGVGDLNSTAPLLGPLANNGGPTQTHALLAGSPAVDTGSGDCPPPTTDQRSVTRPQGASCDIGAFEFEVAPTVRSGDVDCNQAVNSIDAALILQYGAGLLPTLNCGSAGDVNRDDSIDSIDAALVLQHSAGLLPELP